MKSIIFILFFTHLFLIGYTQNDTLIKRNWELKLGFGGGIYGSAEKYIGQKTSIELIGTSFLGFLNSVHLGPKYIVSNKDERLWKVGLVGTFVNINFKEYSVEYVGFGIPVEFSRRRLSVGVQPFVLFMDNRLTFSPLLISICRRWRK